MGVPTRGTPKILVLSGVAFNSSPLGGDVRSFTRYISAFNCSPRGDFRSFTEIHNSNKANH